MDRSFPTHPDKAAARTRLRLIAGLLIIGLGLWLLMERRLDNRQYFVITSESMEPTIKIGERVYMEKAKQYKDGDIIVLEPPGNPAQRLVKRIVATGGDTVMAQGDDLVVNPPPLPLPAPGDRKWQVRDGEVFVAGDNRAISYDSRDFGPIPLNLIHGKVRYRVVSLFRWSEIR